MRKVVVEITPDSRVLAIIEPMMRYIEELEMVDLLRLDITKGIKIGIVRFRFRPGFGIRDAESSGAFIVMEVIEEKDGEALCLIKTTVPTGFDDIREKADLDLKMVPPMKMSKDRFVYSFIGEEEQIMKMMSILKALGGTYKVSFHRAAFSNGDLLSSLTDRQRELLIKAENMGYYRYPREIGTEDLADAVGLSISTVTEHLRKSEARLMREILAGYH